MVDGNAIRLNPRSGVLLRVECAQQPHRASFLLLPTCSYMQLRFEMLPSKNSCGCKKMRMPAFLL